MGKVGSTSLENSIPFSIHLHRLYNIHHKHSFYSPRRKSLLHKILGSCFDTMRRTAIRRRKKIKIITLVRNLYDRNVSAFFQNFAFWIVQYSSKVTEETRKDSTSFVYEVFENIFDHNYAFTWFDKELKKFTGIDIFEHEFNKQRGWQRIQKGKYDILVVKLEALGTACEAIEDFAGVKLKLNHSNLSGYKWYASLYKDFKNNYIPSEEYLHKIYQSKISKHFYTEEETNDFRQKALKKK